MASSMRERITLAVVASMRTLGTVPKEQVFRARVLPVNSDIVPAIVVLDGNELAVPLLNAATLWTFRIDLEVYTMGPEAAADVDPIVLEVNAAMLADRSWGGLARDTAPAPDFMTVENADANQPWRCTGLHYEIAYSTPTADRATQF